MARTHLLHEVVFVQQMKVGLAVHAQFLQHLRVVLRKSIIATCWRDMTTQSGGGFFRPHKGTAGVGDASPP